MSSLLSVVNHDLAAAITHDPLIVTPQCLVTDVLTLMNAKQAVCSLTEEENLGGSFIPHESSKSCALVVEGREIIGIFTEKNVVRLTAERKILTGLTMAQVMTSPVITLKRSEFTDIFATLNLLQRHKIRHLPLLGDDSQILGLVTYAGLRQLLRPVDLMRLQLIEDVMNTEVVHTPRNSNLFTVIELMVKNQVSSVIVTEIGADLLPRPVGIITERDVVQFQILALDFDRITAGMVMSTPLFSLTPEDSLWSARSLMQEKKIRHIVITGKKGELRGIITQTSLLQILNPMVVYRLVEILEEKIANLEQEKLELLNQRNAELAREVEERTKELNLQAEQERLLAHVATRIRASLNLPEILSVSVEEVRQILSCDRVLVYQFYPDGSGTIVAESVAMGWTQSLYHQLDDPCFRGGIASVYAQGRCIAIDNIYAAGYPECYLELLGQYQVKSNLVVPILVENDLWGLLIGHHCADFHPWEPSHLNILDRLAVQLAIAIRQAKIYTQSQTALQERLKAEMALRDSEALFRTTFEQATVGMCHTALNGQFLLVNQCFCDILGYSMAEILNLNVQGITHPEDFASSWQMAIKLINGEISTFSQEKRYICKDGSILWAYITVTLFRNSTGQPQHFIVIVQNINARKAAESSLKLLNQELETRVKQRTKDFQQSEQRFRTLFTVAPDFIYVLDLQGIIQQVNWAAIEQSGYAEEELIGKYLGNFFAPSSHTLFGQHFSLLLHLGRERTELEFICKDGSIRTMDYAATVVYNQNEEPDYIVVLQRDITERKKVELEKQLLKERLQFLLASSPAVIFAWEVVPNYATTFVSDNITTVLGYQVEEFLADPNFWADHVHPEDKEQIFADLSHLFQTGHHIHEYRFLHRNHQYLWVRNELRLVKDETGKPIEIIGYFVDIQDRKIMENDLRQRNEQLAIANVQLESATKLKDEFLANMSHELRTPLNAILGMSEALQEDVFGQINPQQKRALATVERSGKHLLELINDILDLAKIEAGKLELKLAPVSVMSLCQACITMIRLQAVKKNLTLEVNIPEGLADIFIDERYMRQVLINLLSNAIKFTPEGGKVKLEVKIEPGQQRQWDLTSSSPDVFDSSFILFSVADTGIGIAPEDVKKLFQSFVQIDSSLSRQYAGTGLGLALVKQITELHGGWVSIHSELGKGSCFCVRLAYQTTAPNPLSYPLSTTNLPPLLIIQDNLSTTNNHQLSEYLEELGITTVNYHQIADAITAATSLQPSVIILDIYDPQPSYWKLLRQLKADPYTCNIPVVMIGVENRRIRGLSLGATEYLIRPLEKQQLKNTLQKFQVVSAPKSIPQTLKTVKSQSTITGLILLVENNEVTISSLSDYLTSRGYRLIVARTAQEAIQLGQMEKPALMIINMQMPNLDGLAVTQQLRRDEYIANIPIIAMTTLAMASDRERYIQAGVTEYLTQPVKLRQLADIIHNLLSQ
ncbi:PAS fold family [Richelia sinica FACHB-800]|uniref:Circadian input-output histidine kinase CikA n=1 Tax=Richelia sinica FACHB-800 TaxID=1357546 RepID=A0A975Y6T4_9NOST|nr:PAS domain S-box protein [Richelia sinica]MBD2667153.1 PAS domain S-box protein [Richelia sinica FACHB-800]QXE25602.1 PAS fold family [Richelia sinica FACHB-800]